MPTFVQALQTVTDLAERFKLNHPSNEAANRIEFINPFFEALGWDVSNRAANAEQYKDVVHEDSLLVGTATKAPDYSFRIGGVRKFFVEAKKPSADIKGDPHPAYQLRRYAWSAKLPLSLLTDFEEFAVYDCTKRPNPADKASKARILYLTCGQYAQRFREIWDIFAKENVLKGSFDRYAEKARGTALVDAEFLKEIEGWRDEFARNIANRNPRLDIARMNEAVQKVIDRIIFLRMAEDRAIEPQGRLLALINADRIYPRFGKLCEQADAKYNSGLFDFTADNWTLGLDIDDRVIGPILKGLYYPDSPYEFSVIPPEILGNVYEQFLGKVIRLTPGHQAKVEEKPEVKKAGGVYYTPKYIVDYIVKNTVGKLIEEYCGTAENVAQPPPAVKDKNTADGRCATSEASKRYSKRTPGPLPEHFHILDPACGSGSFLLGAYQYLLDHCLAWYIAHSPEKHPKAVYRDRNRQDAKNIRMPPSATAVEAAFKPPPADLAHLASWRFNWRLTIAERKRILLDHLYGVDIDPQAVEVTKLSLLLKVLEGETADSLGRQMQLFRERALPNLKDNIKCGNSLIGPDYFEGKLPATIDKNELGRVNPFDWEHEFPHILGKRLPEKKRGFDAVIGNPPYVRMETFTGAKEYLRTHYSAHEERADLYSYFVERGVRLLNKGGRFGMIVSNKFIRAKYGKPLRKFLEEKATIASLADFAGANVFRGATVRTVVLLLASQSTRERQETIYAPVPNPEVLAAIESGRLTVSDYASRFAFPLRNHALNADNWETVPKDHGVLMDKIRQASPVTLSEHNGQTTMFGLKTGFNEAFILTDTQQRDLVAKDKSSAEIIRPILFGKDVRRYYIRYGGLHLIYCHPNKDINMYPAVREYLWKYRTVLLKRATKQAWFELQQPATALLEHLSQPKIVYPIIADKCRFALDKGRYFINDKLFTLPSNDIRLVALLNSRLANFYFSNVCAALEGPTGRYLEFRAQYVDRFPMPNTASKKATWQKLGPLAAQMLDLHKQLHATKTDRDRELLQRQIDATDRQIDELVYELYGLTDKEIEIVEGVS